MGAEREVEMERGRKDRRRWAEEKKKQTKHKEQRPKERRRGSRQRMSKRESELVATNPGAATSHDNGLSHHEQQLLPLPARPLEPHSSYVRPQPPPKLHNNWTPTIV